METKVRVITNSVDEKTGFNFGCDMTVSNGANVAQVGAAIQAAMEMVQPKVSEVPNETSAQ